jgi:hypothetical protein
MRQSAGALFGARRLAKAEGTFAPAFAKTAKDCTAEWRAEQCKVGATPAASVSPAERCDASAASSAVTVNQHLVFLENSQGVHRRMASRQGGHASPWCDRKGLCRAVQGRRRHAERNRFRTKANRCRAPAESARANRDASCASACAAKAGPHHNRGTRARPSAATFRPQRQGNAGGGAVC